jgi:hypothetical protein
MFHTLVWHTFDLKVSIFFKIFSRSAGFFSEIEDLSNAKSLSSTITDLLQIVNMLV